MKYCLQDKNHNLGNFINCTPTLKAWSIHDNGKPIPIYFETDYVKECFWDCQFIEIWDKKGDEILFPIGIWNKKIPDWEFIYKKYSPFDNSSIPWTYVDQPKSPFGGKYYVVIRGSGNDGMKGYSESKDPGDYIYNYILGKIPFQSVFVGSENDYKYRHVGTDYHMIGDIRAALGTINGAEFVISNDSGLYHAAGAMKKKGFIMWKDTLFEKNRSPNGFMYSFDWQNDFDKWIKGL